MLEVDINSLTDEQRTFLLEKYTDIFERVYQQVLDSYKENKDYLNNYSVITNLKLTPLAKLLFVAKKLAKNVIISHFTGIEPIYLDSDMSSLIDNEQARWESYNRCDVRVLMKTVTNNSLKALEEILADLKDPTKIEKHQEILNALNTFYIEGYNVVYNKTYSDGRPCTHELAMAGILNRMGYLNRDQFLQANAIIRRHIGLYMTVDIMQELKDTYVELGQKLNGKVR